jgi:hypothetical protein
MGDRYLGCRLFEKASRCSMQMLKLGFVDERNLSTMM